MAEYMNKDLKVKEFFDGKADDYLNHYYLNGLKNCHVHNQQVRREYFKYLIKESNIQPYGFALDIGSGPGSITQELVRFGFNTFGIDLSYKMLLNNRKNSGNHAKLTQCFADMLCFKDNSFDLVTAAGVMEYVKADRDMLKEIKRVLKPGATLIISVPVKSITTSVIKKFVNIVFGRRDNGYYHKQYTPKISNQLLEEAGLAILATVSHHFVFFPIDFLFPRSSAKIDCLLTRLLKTNVSFGRLGKTFIIKATKP